MGKTPFGSKPKTDKIPDHGKKADTIKQDPIKSLEARDYKKEYHSYHGTPKQRKNRSTRNQARRKMELETGDDREVDHSKPLSQGGTNHGNNLKVVSFAKNRAKGAKHEAIEVGDAESIRIKHSRYLGTVHTMKNNPRDYVVAAVHIHPCKGPVLQLYALSGGSAGAIRKATTGELLSHW